jgi:hypothetical protein
MLMETSTASLAEVLALAANCATLVRGIAAPLPAHGRAVHGVAALTVTCSERDRERDRLSTPTGLRCVSAPSGLRRRARGPLGAFDGFASDQIQRHATGSLPSFEIRLKLSSRLDRAYRLLVALFDISKFKIKNIVALQANAHISRLRQLSCPSPDRFQRFPSIGSYERIKSRSLGCVASLAVLAGSLKDRE